MQYIIDFHNNTPENEISDYLSLNGCTVLKEWDNFDKVYLVEAGTEPPTTAITMFVKHDSELSIKPLFEAEIHHNYYDHSHPSFIQETIPTSGLQHWWKNYSNNRPDFDNPTLTFPRKGQNVNVYIMDSGIDSTHFEFNSANISNLFTITPNDFTDKKGHGTAIASVIAGKTCGITDAKIKNVKIFEPGHNTLQSELLSALDAILNDVPEHHAAIVNCSWVIDKNPWVEFKFLEMIQQGVWVICAAGNNGTEIGNVTPASMPEVFTIGSYNIDLLPSTFSNYTGDHLSTDLSHTNEGELDAWAPGENIYVANLGNTFGYVNGTSIATAIATACCAYNLSRDIKKDGTFAESVRNSELNTLNPTDPRSAWILVGNKKDLLDLSDPKYSLSINVIATFGGSPVDIPIVQAPDEFTCVLRVGVSSGCATVLQPSLTKSFVFTTLVPDNFTILPSGNFYGTPASKDGPQGDEKFVQYNLEAIRIDNNDVAENIKITLYIVKQDFNYSDLPDDHPVNLTLQAEGCVNTNGSCVLQPAAPCSPNNCFGFYSVCCDPGGKSFCICFAF